MSNLFIALFLTLLAINISYNFISEYIDQLSENLTVFIMMSAFFMAPSLYLYLKASINTDYKLTWRDGVHLFPFILFNMFILNDVYIVNALNETIPSSLENSMNIVLYSGFYLLFFFYLSIGFRLLWKTKKLYVENFSNTDIRRFNYLFQLNAIVSFVILSSAIKNYIVFNKYGEFIGDSVIIVLLLLLLLFCWIIYKGLNSPELFNEEAASLNLVSEMIHEVRTKSDNYSSIVDQRLVMEISEEQVDRLTRFMKEEKPYLDPTLSLQELANRLEVPPRELSILINHHLSKHFFDFVNDFRIEHAKAILSDPSKQDLTILEILYEVGFNSKSSFNSAFKKVTGFTPTQFRKGQFAAA
jgi:AraC-like DNA-binding protein